MLRCLNDGGNTSLVPQVSSVRGQHALEELAGQQ